VSGRGSESSRLGTVADVLGIVGFLGSVATFMLSRLMGSHWHDRVPVGLAIAMWLTGLVVMLLGFRRQVWNAFRPRRGRSLTVVLGAALMVAASLLMVIQ
jgi:hypothetical protein